MKITHVFPDGTRTPDINGLRVPYTAQTAAAYQAVAPSVENGLYLVPKVIE